MFYAAQDLRIRAGKDVPSPNAPTASVKKAGTAWKHWTSQIDDHLKPSTVAKRCTSLYPSTKIERPQRARNGASRRRSFSGFGWPGQPPPHTRPNAVQVPPARALHLRPETGTQGRHGRNREPFYGRPVLLPRVDAGFCPQDAFGGRSRQAEHLACPAHGWVKPPAEIFPPVIGVMGATLPPSRPLRSFFPYAQQILKIVLPKPMWTF